MQNERATRGASVTSTENGWRLGIQKGDSLHYRDAQLDDYSQLPRHKFPHQTLSLSLRARTSSISPAGTWGFGLWNDPFGLSLGFGGSPFRLPALPNAAWFFYASPQNYLSFKNGQSQRIVPTNGFLAQTFRSPKFHPLLMLAGLTLPFSRKSTRKLLSKVIQEDATSLWSPTVHLPCGCCRDMQERPQGTRAPALQSQGVDVTQWHRYRLEWKAKRTAWYVDDALVFESPISPKPPLGVIIWIDNQYAAFTPEGKIAFGVLEGEEEWLEVEDILISER
jgi:hypothetical protein